MTRFSARSWSGLIPDLRHIDREQRLSCALSLFRAVIRKVGSDIAEFVDLVAPVVERHAAIGERVAPTACGHCSLHTPCQHVALDLLKAIPPRDVHTRVF